MTRNWPRRGQIILACGLPILVAIATIILPRPRAPRLGKWDIVIDVLSWIVIVITIIGTAIMTRQRRALILCMGGTSLLVIALSGSNALLRSGDPTLMLWGTVASAVLGIIAAGLLAGCTALLIRDAIRRLTSER